MLTDHVTSPIVGDFQSEILATLTSDGKTAVDFSEDVAPLGLQPAPI